MFVATSSHLALWVERNKPAWARDIVLPVRATVHGIINKRAGIKHEISISNAEALLPMIVRRGKREGLSLRYILATWDNDGPCESTKRARYYHRWARGIIRGEARRTISI